MMYSVKGERERCTFNCKSLCPIRVFQFLELVRGLQGYKRHLLGSLASTLALPSCALPPPPSVSGGGQPPNGHWWSPSPGVPTAVGNSFLHCWSVWPTAYGNYGLLLLKYVSCMLSFTSLGGSCVCSPVDRLPWGGTEASVHQLVRNQSLPMNVWVNSEADLPAPTETLRSLQPQLTAWLQAHERPWARPTQLSHSRIPDPQKLCEIIKLLKLLGFEVTCCIAMDS